MHFQAAVTVELGQYPGVVVSLRRCGFMIGRVEVTGG